MVRKKRTKEPEMFSAYFFADFKIKPFVRDLDTFDDESGYLDHLEQMIIDNGWLQGKVITVSIAKAGMSDELTGHMLNGRHRSIVLDRLQKRGFPVPQVRVEFVPVRSFAHIEGLRIHYEVIDRTKDTKVSEKHVQLRAYRLFQENEIKDEKQAIKFMHDNGCPDQTEVVKLFRRYQKTLLVNKPYKSGGGSGRGAGAAAKIFSDGFSNRLKQKDADFQKKDAVLSSSTTAGAGEQSHHDHSKLRCPSCNVTLSLQTLVGGGFDLKLREEAPIPK